MTKRRAERLTGYEIRSVRANDGKVAYGAFHHRMLIVLRSHFELKEQDVPPFPEPLPS
jgi:hypothetical protein